jgi:hypothetical protein
MLKALDLFCGRGGASMGLKAAGFHTTGVDLEPQPEYCGDRFIQSDAMVFPLDGFDFIWASSPCQEFAKFGMRMFHPNPSFPALGLRLFNETRIRLEGCGLPYVMENVRAAQQFVGPAINHLGPFYLWGNAVPAVFPPDLYTVSKGFGKLGSDGIRSGPLAVGSKSKARKEFTAKASMIPLEIGEYIGRTVAEDLLRHREVA